MTFLLWFDTPLQNTLVIAKNSAHMLVWAEHPLNIFSDKESNRAAHTHAVNTLGEPHRVRAFSRK